MALLDFPSNPTVGQTYSFNGRTWTWNGTGWAMGGGPIGPTGYTGPIGPTGTTGNTGPGGLVLLNTLTASSSASLDDTTDITSAYELYLVEFHDLVPVADSDLLLLQYSILSTFQTTNYVCLIAGGFVPGFGSSASADGGSSVAGIYLSGDGGTNFNGIDHTKSGVSGQVFLHFQQSSAIGAYKKTTGSCTWEALGTNTLNTATIGGVYKGGVGIVDGIRIKFKNGNIVSGTVRIYGVKT